MNRPIGPVAFFLGLILVILFFTLVMPMLTEPKDVP